MSTMTAEPQKPPAGLTSGRQTVLDMRWQSLCAHAGRAAPAGRGGLHEGRNSLLEKAVRELPDLVATGSMGQAKVHPLLNELRLHRTLLKTLVEQLNLPDDGSEVGLRAGQKHARKAAMARWKGGAWRSVGLGQ